ncbi:C-type lectin domain family 17, member A-like isoform X2 [Piliocolobus tephrosceles]|uniref:C-type lectin domain family 17, member A-like isoform X2 n=1 Tax=Piliocolobus tephrosceles TaxID=591936 RepID=UPI000E6B14A8|nr:C-type lectin domain family 17, member A-like isoform X2 [Piliocolobus tephrosceles]
MYNLYSITGYPDPPGTMEEEEEEEEEQEEDYENMAPPYKDLPPKPDAQSSLWRGSHGKELRPPTNSHVSVSSWKQIL